jgi:hypothetical protein
MDDFDYFPFVSGDDLKARDAWFENGCPIDDIEYADGVDDPNYIVTGCNDDWYDDQYELGDE